MFPEKALTNAISTLLLIGSLVACDGNIRGASKDDTPTNGNSPADCLGNSTGNTNCGSNPPSDPNLPLVIFDTDMGPDIDDVLALSMLHTYADQNQIELAAVTVSRNSLPGALFSDAINTFYGRPDIPVGVYRGETEPAPDRFAVLFEDYTHDLTADEVHDGDKLQRRVLARARAEKRSVILIQVGFSGNHATLLQSEPDELSNLSGQQLVEQHVSLLSVMAGRFYPSAEPEFNIKNDLRSAQALFRGWPGEMVVSGWRVGGYLPVKHADLAQKFDSTHLVRAAYEFQYLDWHVDAPPFYDMRSWDLTSVLEALEPGKNWFRRSNTGTVTLDEQGRSTFRENNGRHRILSDSRTYDEGHRQQILRRMLDLIN